MASPRSAALAASRVSSGSGRLGAAYLAKVGGSQPPTPPSEAGAARGTLFERDSLVPRSPARAASPRVAAALAAGVGVQEGATPPRRGPPPKRSLLDLP